MEKVNLTELSRMIFDDKSDVICRFVREHPHSALIRTEDGDTLLHLSCWAKRIDAVQILLAAGADVNARGESGRTPLHYAVYEGDPRSVGIVRALVSHGADPVAVDDNGFTPADWAKMDMAEGLPEVLDLLAATPPRSPSTTDPGRYDLHETARRGDFLTLRKILHEHPTLVDNRAPSGDTPLHMACFAKQMCIIATLSASGADVNAKGNGGRTAPPLRGSRGNSD